MKLIENWDEILKKAWSIKFILLAALFSGAEVALPFFTDLVPRGTMALLSAFATAGALVTRVLVQKGAGDEPTE